MLINDIRDLVRLNTEAKALMVERDEIAALVAEENTAPTPVAIHPTAINVYLKAVEDFARSHNGW